LSLESPDGVSIPENRRLETMFLLQGLHGAETGDQLVTRSGLSRDELLTRTNLAEALVFGLKKATIASAKSRQMLEQLQAAEAAGSSGP
jgi:hypothetical protein